MYICKFHKRYRGKYEPRVACAGCWHIYLIEEVYPQASVIDEYLIWRDDLP